LNPVEYTIEDSISLGAPTRAGYTFAGWYLDSRFTPSRQVTEIQAGSTGNKVLYAKWIKE
ncbi:MAG: InlB B-repeat-containing protein, partial [Lachnospiraceae bacterium]|nr:InlB B-repeat-containing protein [Lachnospiraceae bacterium]